jgi:tetratricopeptide (TPR) repeat protein
MRLLAMMLRAGAAGALSAALASSGCSGGAPAETYVTAQTSFDAGLESMQTGNHAQAVEQFTAAIDAGGLTADLLETALVQRAVARAEAGDPATALLELDAAQARVSNVAAVHQGRARVHFLKGDKSLAKSEFQRAQSLNRTLKAPQEYK